MFKLPKQDLVNLAKEFSSEINTFNKKSFLITGGTGFIGKWLIAVLNELNRINDFHISLTILTRDKNKFISAFKDDEDLKNLKFIESDIRHLDNINNKELAFDYIVLGANDATYDFSLNPNLLTDTLIGGTRLMIEKFVTNKTNTILHLSSGAVYGDIAKLNNADLLVAKLDYQIAEKDLTIEKAKLSPSASINYSKSENKDYSSTIDELDQETVKATISWPIIKGGENISAIKKSSFKKQRSLLLSEDAENRVITETTNAWSNYQSSESVLTATEAQLKAAEIANEGITLEYDSGNTRTTLEVIQSRSLLLDARIAFAKAERDFMISKFELAFQLGTLSLSSIKSL